MDIGIVWRPCRVLELTCIKPTNRVAEFLSLGIPVVFQATAAYADIVVEWGYPLVANNVTHALQLVVRAWWAGGCGWEPPTGTCLLLDSSSCVAAGTGYRYLWMGPAGARLKP